MSEKKPHITVTWKKGALLFLFSFVSLIITGRFLLTTSLVHEIVKNKIERAGEESLNGTLRIEKLEGDLWNEILITGIQVVQIDTLLKIDSLSAEYSAWSFLTGENKIRKISTSGFFATIKEGADSTYNFEKLAKTDDSESSESLQFEVDQISVRKSGARIYSSTVLPDSTLNIENITVDASFSNKEEIRFSLNSLSFLIKEGRLPEPIKVRTSGQFEQQQVTLQELVLETGRSVLKAEASTSLADSTITSQLNTIPISLEDLQPYLDKDLPNENLEMSISASGSLKDLNLKLHLNSQYMPNLEVFAGVDLSEKTTLTHLGVSGDGLDIAYFTSDSIPAKLGRFELTLDGIVTEDIGIADAIWDYDIKDIRYEGYGIRNFTGNGTLKRNELMGEFIVNSRFNERLNGKYAIAELSTLVPKWYLEFDLIGFDASNWTTGKDFYTNLDFKGNIEGKGFELSENLWTYSVLGGYSGSEKLSITDQLVSGYELNGSLSKNEFTGSGHLTLDKSSADLKFNIVDFLEEIPLFEYSISTEGFDLSEVNSLEDFPTSINLELQGEGEGKEIANSLISASVRIDSSIINGSGFQEFSADLGLENGIGTISKGMLKSDIFGGYFSGRRNVNDFTDPDNKLSINFTIQDLQPLAPLANAEVLSASGVIIGDITQASSGVLACDLLIDLEDVQIDTLFTSPRMFGEAKATLEEIKTFDINFAIESPVISNITLQDIYLESIGIANEDTLFTDFSLEVIGSDRGELYQEGLISVDVSENQLDLQLSKFDFTTSGSVLRLEKEFNLRLKDKGIGTDTLKLQSTSGAFLNFVMPYADSLEQHAWIHGESFDFGVIQEVIFDKRFLDGVLSGEIEYENSLDNLTGSGALTLDRVNYQGIKADQLRLNFTVENQRLLADGFVNWEGEDKIVGSLDVPFILFDKEALDDEFFNEPVLGSLTIAPSDLDRFQGVLERFEITQTSGILDFSGVMNGTAAEPHFEGDMKIESPVLSGISLDSVLASFNYDNTQSGLLIESEILKSDQKAAEIEIEYPASYDFRNMVLNLPGENDSIKVDLKTNDFNIAALNDFVDQNYLNRLTGRLNADVQFEGTQDNIKPTGYITLNDARVNIPVAGITLEYLTTDFTFTNEGLEVKNISAKSGGGDFKAKGSIELDGIFPKTLNIDAQASQFKLANTDDYNMVVDLDGKLSGPALTPIATGKVTVRNGFVFMENFGEKTIEVVELDGVERTPFSPYDSLEIDMDIEIRQNFFVRSRGYLNMEVEIAGEVDAQKQTGEELELFGSFNGLEGYIRPLGKRFDMEEATFTFSGPLDDPYLSIKSKYIPPTRQKGESVILYYLIEGHLLDDDIYSFDSNPQMEQSDIICFTLFNRPCSALESWQSVFAGGGNTSATDLLAEVLLDEVEALATRELGVDVVQINTTGSGSQSGTAIKTGWYLNESTFFAIINEITNSSPKTLFVLEYILSEKVDLILTQGNDSRQGIDLRFQHDY